MCTRKLGNSAVEALAGFGLISYGSFWIFNHLGIYHSSRTDVGIYLIAWTLLTFIFWISSLFIHSTMAFTFTTLLIGFPQLTKFAEYDLIICALGAWYMMGSITINDVSGSQVIKAEKPWLKLKR